MLVKERALPMPFVHPPRCATDKDVEGRGGWERGMNDSEDVYAAPKARLEERVGHSEPLRRLLRFGVVGWWITLPLGMAIDFLAEELLPEDLAGFNDAALDGLEQGTPPPAPVTGSAYGADLPQLPQTWADAIDAFDRSPEIQRIFAPELRDTFLATKRQELRYMAELSPEEQQELYLDTV